MLTQRLVNCWFRHNNYSFEIFCLPLFLFIYLFIYLFIQRIVLTFQVKHLPADASHEMLRLKMNNNNNKNQNVVCYNFAWRSKG